MSERVRSASVAASYRGPKMESDLSPRKTMLVLVIVIGCFAVLWPKVFYPMLVGSATQHLKPSPIDKTTGCCDVISEIDVNTIKIMSELCGTIIKSPEDRPLTGKEIVQRCRQEVLETCGIDISVVLQEQVRLGESVKQILDEVRSLNGSLCLKYNYGVAPWRLGVPHRITVKMASDPPNIRQERPLHLRSELIHPAFRERGRAIPQPQPAPPTRPPPRVVEGRPGPLPGMRPTLGGAGHVVPPSKQGTSSMSVIMPIYTIGIVIFFTYTLMRIIFKKQPEGVGGSLYPSVDPDPHFRKEVFESEASRLGSRLTRESISSKLVVNAMSALLDEVDQEIEARRKSSEVASQDLVNGTLSNGDVVKPQENEEQPTVKVLGMEMTASCEGGKKWSRPDSPVLPTSPPPPTAEPAPPPQEIYLEGTLPAESHLLVSDSATEPQPTTGEDPAVVLAGKMTLSVISLDSDNGADESTGKPQNVQIQEPSPQIETLPTLKEQIAEALQESVIESKHLQDVQIEEFQSKAEDDMEDSEYEIEEYVLEPIVTGRFEIPPASKADIEDLEKKLKESSHSPIISEETCENIVQSKPLIQLESEDIPHTVEVEKLEAEVDNLIQEAVENIDQRQPSSTELLQDITLATNEINDNLQNLEIQVEKKEIQQAEGPLITDDTRTKKSLEEPTVLQVSAPLEEAGSVVEELTNEPTTNEVVSLVEEIQGISIEERKTKDQAFREESLSKNVMSEDEATTTKLSDQEAPQSVVEESITPVLESQQKIEEKRQIESNTQETLVVEPPQMSATDVNKTQPVVTEASIKAAEVSQQEESVKQVLEASQKIEEKEQTKSNTQDTRVSEPHIKFGEPSQTSEEISTAISSDKTEDMKIDIVELPQKNDGEKVSEFLEKSIVEEISVKLLIEPPQTIEEKGQIESNRQEIQVMEPLQVIGTDIKQIQSNITEIPEASITAAEFLQGTEPGTEESKTGTEQSGESKVDILDVPNETAQVVKSDENQEKNDLVLATIPSSSNNTESTLPDEKPKSVESIKITEAKKVDTAELSTSPNVDVTQKDEGTSKLEATTEINEQIAQTNKVTSVETTQPSTPSVEEKSEEKHKIIESSNLKAEEHSECCEPVAVLIDDDELGSEEEMVEEIEEIVYESNDQSEEEESEVEIGRNTTRTGPSFQRVNGQRSEDLVEESKYTTASGATAAENDISDEELTDNEEVDDEEGIIDVEEELEDDDYIGDEDNDINHLSESEPEL